MFRRLTSIIHILLINRHYTGGGYKSVEMIRTVSLVCFKLFNL